MVTNRLSTLYDLLLKIIGVIITVLFSALVIVTFSNVVSRYFLDFALAWAEETARFLFIWITFLGAVLAHAYNEHMGLDLVVNSLPQKIGKVLLFLSKCVILVILYMMIKGGITIWIQNIDWMTPALEISYGKVYSIVPICSIILAIQTIVSMIKLLKPSPELK